MKPTSKSAPLTNSRARVQRTPTAPIPLMNTLKPSIELPVPRQVASWVNQKKPG